MSCLAAATILSTSCSKDDEDEPTTVNKSITKIVKTINNSMIKANITTYDNNGRILTQTVKLDNYESKIIYEYTDNTMTMTSGSSNMKDVFTIENGRVTECVYQYSETTNAKINYSYSSNGYLSSRTIENSENQFSNATYKYTEKNGNYVSYDCEQSGITHYNFDYTDKLNNFSVDITGLIINLGNGGNNVFGKRSKNLPSECSIDEKSKTTYTYTYDGDYLVKIIEEQDGEIVSTYEIFYE